ncbi:FHA domain-containing protein [Schlegelella sp. ID0723]|uniref:FHA domain-containing protein n=2 Tax=Piscinibacter koreensis TaxID=2742824 RepID=A0A7Y6NRF5_9BURK|nr:FHA domain-containing protein [Schlegelella koreensis]
MEAIADPDDYGELIAALRSTPTAALRPYEVTVLGRWIEPEPARTPASPVKAVAGTPATPLAAPRCEFDVEDAGGPRRIALQAVVPGRRYVIGKGDAADLRVDGTYTSRRHAEVWSEHGAWWVVDAGSTNGTRVEPAGAHAGARVVTANQPVELAEGARIVLSARAEGPAADYPRLALRVAARAAAPLTPIARPSLRTPMTEVLPPRVVEPRYELTALQASGTQSLEVGPSALPLSVGRSRNQTLVVDRRHEGVSGHHLDIVAFDDSGAEAIVHGDNGVRVDGVEHAPGTRFHWRFGDTLVLGAAPTDAPPCWLTLMRSEPVSTSPR